VKDQRLLQGPTTILLYIVVVSILSPQRMDQSATAMVRYLCPLIPLCIFTGCLTIRVLAGIIARASRRLPGALPKALPIGAGALLGIVAFGTNILHSGPLGTVGKPPMFAHPIHPTPIRSTICLYARDVLFPPPSAYQSAADWIRRNVPAGASVWAVPEFTPYPLIFHAPHAVYAWQLPDPPPEQFRDVDPIHIEGRIPPDYIVVFGPVVQHARTLLGGWQRKGLRYVQVERLDVYWYDLTRPELFWHAFGTVRNFDPDLEGITIFARVKR